MDRLRVGGWLPPPRHALERGRVLAALPAAPARVGAHAAPDAADQPERRELPPAYEAPPVDFDAPVSAPVPPPARRTDLGVGRYVYQGRRRIGEMIGPGPRRQGVWLGLAGVALLAVAIAAVATLSPDSGDPGAGQGLALPTAPPQAPEPSDPEPSAEERIGEAPPRSKSAPATHAGPLELAYEAEDAALIGGAEVLSLRVASGGRIVQGIGTGSDRRPGLISFTEVDVPATNRYALTVEYVSGEDRTAILTINTETHVKLSFPSSGDWDAVASQTFTIRLVGGRNNLTFSNPDGWAPRLDRINLLG